MRDRLRIQGFTVVEITVGIVLMGLVLLAFAGMANVMHSSSSRTKQFSDAQQNARVAVDFISENLRTAGSDVAVWAGQETIVHAGPYQVAFNADIDQGEVLGGEQPMDAMDVAQSPNTVPPSGTVIYAPGQTYDSGAETTVLTLDSNLDGIVDTADRGDDPEESLPNPHVFVLKRHTYGHVTGASNTVRTSNVSMLRGPIAYADGTNPPPLFEYYYNDDDDLTTPDLLWGDADGNGELDDSEISTLVEVPDSMLYAVRKVKVNVVAEGLQKNNRIKDNNGYATVLMNSTVWIRNVDFRESARVFGTVYYDANGNGVMDKGEPGMPAVAIELQGASRHAVTDNFGFYSIPTGPGDFTVVETDPSGFTSSTSNTVAVSLQPGQKRVVNFGDTGNYLFGYVTGHVYHDANENTYYDGGEEGLPGTVVSLDNDMSAKADDSGYYRITVPVGSYTVTETDLEGYGSTTPNSVNVTIAAQGDSAVVNFGDIPGQNTGSIEGYVYVDEDEDGDRDFNEPGLENVILSLSDGTQTATDASGYYQFDLDPGKYDVYELDPEGYTSTTPNLIEDVWVAADSVVIVDFGDAVIKDLDFIEIFVGDTDRPLSVSPADMREDGNRDIDIVLGTPTSSGPGNAYFFINNWESSSTPLSSLFNSSADFVRNANTDVNAILTFDYNRDMLPDVLTAQESADGNNLMFWFNDSTGAVGDAPAVLMTSGASSFASTLELREMTGDSDPDILVGHRSSLATYGGGFELFSRYLGSYYSVSVETDYAPGQPLGQVVALDTGDLDLDGDLDLVVGSNSGPYWGNIDIYLNDGTGHFTWFRRYLAKAGVNDVDVVELGNDKLGLPDLLVGVSVAQNVGGLQVWTNGLKRFGSPDTTGFVYDAYTVAAVPDYYLDAGGEVLTVDAAFLDLDIYPEILIGTRSSLFYTGDLLLVRRFADSVSVNNIKVNIAGEVVTIDLADFNKDSRTDIVVTTRTSQTSGKLAIYFVDDSTLIP